MPMFTMSVEVDGEVYVGKGRSKKLAKSDAADQALKSIIQFKAGPSGLQNVSGNEDFTSDDFTTNIETGLIIIIIKLCNFDICMI